MSPATVLLSSPPDSTGDELRKLVAAAGFVVADHLLGSPPAVDFGPIVTAVIEVGSRSDVAAAQTRRWRAELGDQFVPVLWVVPADKGGGEPGGAPDQRVAGLDAGADAVLARPVDPAVFVAQVRGAGPRAGRRARVWPFARARPGCWGTSCRRRSPSRHANRRWPAGCAARSSRARSPRSARPGSTCATGRGAGPGATSTTCAGSTKATWDSSWGT
ncbi:response regulator transcription factor [Frigoriglobus tundricola]|uniref:Response regulatory domain-containing protein n=1 Tax=Frigoriglobus tundricola TaxID=2774151 RepID=A0A6M5YSF7_9BACT|nr:response regulator transcription factor [Frigoriglobus tundricola]QJW96809.1 hypothetical protein FTUN_4368 [Frigoriglobus tundricola]